MTTGEYLSSPIYFATLVAAAIGSLFACRGIGPRVWFTLAMPVLYGFVWFIFLLATGTVVTPLLQGIEPRLSDLVVVGSSTLLTAATFTLMVTSMAKDRPRVQRSEPDPR